MTSTAKRRLLGLLAAFAALAFMEAAAAQGASAPQPGASAGAVARGDSRFLHDAAQGGMAEVRASRMAVDKAVNTQVKGYAQQMVDDHAKADEALKALAAKKGVTLPAEPSLAQKAKLELLSSSDGASFDRRYASTWGVSAHRDTVRLFQKAATSAADPDIKAYAAKTLPTLQHHLQMAGELKVVASKEGNAKALHDRKQ